MLYTVGFAVHCHNLYILQNHGLECDMVEKKKRIIWNRNAILGFGFIHHSPVGSFFSNHDALKSNGFIFLSGWVEMCCSSFCHRKMATTIFCFSNSTIHSF